MTTIDNSFIIINPDLNNKNCKEYDELQKLINEGINEEQFKYVSENNNKYSLNNESKSLCDNKIIHLKTLINNLQSKLDNNASDKSDNEISEFFTIKATVLEFEHGNKNYYFGCKKCKKKLIQKDNDYFCPLCETIETELNYYYILTLRVIDITGEHSLNVFGEQVTNLFGIDAKAYSNLVENNEIEKLKQITNKIEYHTFYFYGKANLLKYSNRTRIQLSAYKIEEENFPKEKRKVFEDIQNAINQIK